jgi:hypothetical protein
MIIDSFSEYCSKDKCSLCENFCYPYDNKTRKYIDTGYALCSANREDEHIIQELSSNYKKLYQTEFDYYDVIPDWCNKYKLRKLYENFYKEK